jgi:hypothetical protein
MKHSLPIRMRSMTKRWRNHAAALGLNEMRLIREVISGAHAEAHSGEDFRSGVRAGVNSAVSSLMVSAMTASAPSSPSGRVVVSCNHYLKMIPIQPEVRHTCGTFGITLSRDPIV